MPLIELKSLPVATKSPNLPIPTTEYERAYLDELTKQLRLYFAQLDNFTQAIANPSSGTTAQRPVSTTQIPLAIGQFYYDTTLGIPIYWNGTVWKNASGTTV
jgi:hypothetical protein